MAQGRSPHEWGGKGHTALHASFPAASVFKTVVTTAAFEMTDFDAVAPVGLNGSCAHVKETGEWLKDRDRDKNPVVALREIAEQTVRPVELQDALVGTLQKVVVDDDDTPDEISSIARSAEALRLTAAAPPRSPAGGGGDFE